MAWALQYLIWRVALTGYQANKHRRRAAASNDDRKLPNRKKTNDGERYTDQTEIGPHAVPMCILRRSEKLNCDPDADGKTKSQAHHVAGRVIHRPQGFVLGQAHSNGQHQQTGNEDHPQRIAENTETGRDARSRVLLRRSARLPRPLRVDPGHDLLSAHPTTAGWNDSNIDRRGPKI